MVPEEKRLKEDFKWLINNSMAIQKKNAGKYIAIVDKHIVGVGNTATVAFSLIPSVKLIDLLQKFSLRIKTKLGELLLLTLILELTLQ